TLFDRSGRYTTLTPQGAVLLADARNISSGLDFMKARAKGMAAGLEPELSVVVDVLSPIAAITEAAKEFREKFPGTPLRRSPWCRLSAGARRPCRVWHRRIAAA